MTTQDLMLVDEYARNNGLASEEVVDKIRSGNLIGQIIDGVWYVDAFSGKRDSARKSDTFNTTTAIMLAAANIDNENVLNAFNERSIHPFKADTPEYGLDIQKIKNEALQVKQRRFMRNGVILFFGIFMFIGLFMLIDAYVSYYRKDPTGGWLLFLFSLFIISISDFMYTSISKTNARHFLNGVSDSSTKDLYSFESTQNVII